PSSSSAAEVGVEIICYLTSPSAELERRDRGVGMPTREAFYSGEGQVMLSSYSSLPAEKLGKVIENAFRRSGCPDYMRFSNLLGRTLQRIIEIPESTDKDAISLSVKEIWKEFERNFETLNIPVELL
ncbi:MAG: hypothetical protein NT023_02020, partial [Armatimonadetes bacterium]|nr:hypothetical protein [Armatimonadota bacterium]